MFIDNLALTEAFLLFAASILTYMGVTSWWALRQNDPVQLRSSLRGAAVPVGGVGLVAVILGFWEEMVWPYPSTMGGYNILFNDITLVFGAVMVAFAATAYLGLRLQYVGVFAFVAGAVTVFYGWTGYGFAYTKEPLDFLLLYLGFGAAGIFTLPATVIVDYYLERVAGHEEAWRTSVPARTFFGRRLGIRAVQKLDGSGTSSPPAGPGRYRLPVALEVLVLLFPVFMALAGIAAMWFLGTTLPGHLTPGKAP